MLINADVKGLEWVAAANLSKDKVAKEEILTGVDQHSDNQKRFNLPSRLIAKTFVFRLIYGGSAYAYSIDPEFSSVGYSEKEWQKVINEFYSKYKGISEWHTKIVQEVTKTGIIKIPTGREFKFFKDEKGEWPRPSILNYPVQGFGADLVMLGRISAFRRFKEQKIEGVLISSVHDSLLADVVDSEVYRAGKILKSSIEDIPINFERIFGVKFELPMTAEIQVGKNLKEVVDLKV